MERIQEVSMQDYIITKDTYGDWCMPPESQELIHSQDPTRITAGPVLSTTVYYSLLNLMTEFAQLTGKNEDITGYQELAVQIKDTYNNVYINADSAMYDNNTVTANILSLRLGLVPEGKEIGVYNNIVQKTEVDFNGHVSTGVLGIQHLMRGLTEYGNVDLAGIKNHPESIAFKKLLMEPKFPEGLTHVNASYSSVYGEIESEWKKDQDSFIWNITIPGNTSAIVKLPKELNIIIPEGKAVRNVSNSDLGIEIELGSGTYKIVGNL